MLSVESPLNDDHATTRTSTTLRDHWPPIPQSQQLAALLQIEAGVRYKHEFHCHEGRFSQTSPPSQGPERVHANLSYRSARV